MQFQLQSEYEKNEEQQEVIEKEQSEQSIESQSNQINLSKDKNQNIITDQQILAQQNNENHINLLIQQPLLQKKYINDLEFRKQKIFLILILVLFFFWSLIYRLYLLTFFSISGNEEEFSFIYFISFLVSLALIMILNLMGVKKKQRKDSTIFFFIIVILYMWMFYSFYSTNIFQDEDRYDILLVQQFNILTTITMIVYLLVEQKGINFLGMDVDYIAYFCFNIIIMGLISYFLLGQIMKILLSIPYTIVLTISLEQTINKKLQFEADQIFSGALSANFFLICCCTTEDEIL